jgi:predicted dehydrogenase
MTWPTAPTDRPLRAFVVGAGAMGRWWLRAIRDFPEVELAGLVDLDPVAARDALAETGSAPVPLAASLAGLDRVPADFVVDVTVPHAHHPVTLEALRRGLPVLGEKPLAATMSEALELVAAAEAYQRLFMVSQSRRYERHVATFHARVGRLGPLGVLVATFFRAPRFGGFRDAMAHPLLLDMAIHAFDTARLLTSANPLAVYCEEYNPRWSWYAGDAAASALFELTGGVRFVFTGSWCSDGLETSWNGAWRASGAHGTAVWDGDGPPAAEPDAEPQAHEPPGAVDHPGIEGSLRDFVNALRTGTQPMGECHDNLYSLAMVHAAVASAGQRQRIAIADLLEKAHAEALSRAQGEVREALAGWTTLVPRAQYERAEIEEE